MFCNVLSFPTFIHVHAIRYPSYEPSVRFPAVPEETYTDKNLARAYFVSESYDRAEAVLEELIPCLDASTDHVLNVSS